MTTVRAKPQVSGPDEFPAPTGAGALDLGQGSQLGSSVAPADPLLKMIKEAVGDYSR